MGKKFRKLMCSVLALAMLATSGIAVLADEVATEATEETAVTTMADADATEAPEETAEPTAEPTATPEPTQAPDPYAQDNYYNKALSLCSALGIITGYDDGSVKPESTVTRAEMAAIILRMTAVTSLSTYRNLFTDVASSHWAANTIQTASDDGVINGMGDGTFAPDGNVTYEQAIKMVVCGMNYGKEAELKGGYPDGYIAVATSNLSLLDSVKGTRGTAMTRGEIIKLVYNALIGPYNELRTQQNGAPVYSSTQTLAKAKFNLIEAKGLLTATNTKSIISVNPPAGQVIIDTTDADTDTFLCDIKGIDDLVGNKINFYYTDNGVADERVVAILTDAARTEEVVIDASDIERLLGFESGKGEIRTYSGKKYETEDATIIYNNDYITPGIYRAAVAGDTANRFDFVGFDGTKPGRAMTYDEFIRPRVGTVKLVDNNSDGDYDIVFVDSLETIVIASATEKKITGTINGNAVTLDVDATNLDKTVTVTVDDTEAKPKNLKKDNVVTLKRNLANNVLDFERVDNSVSGKISGIEEADASSWAVATINGQEYAIDINAVKDAEVGVEGTFVLDKFDRIGNIIADSLVSSSEKYGWILSAYLSDTGEEYMVRLFTQDGQAQAYKFASKVNYWGPGAQAAASYSLSQLKTALDNISYNRVGSVASGQQIRLVKYSLNSKNEVTKLYVASTVDASYTKGNTYSDADATYDKNALVINTTNMKSKNSTGNILGGKLYMSDGMLEFRVPNSDADMSDASNYSISTVNASEYLSTEGINKDCIFGEFSDDKQTKPTVVVRFVGASTAAAKAEDYGTASDNPIFMVKKVNEGVDADGEPVYTISGYRNGAEEKYVTKTNTVIARRNAMFPSKDQYGTEKLWDAVNGLSDVAKAEGASSIQDVIGVGDIVGVSDNGAIFIIMVDASVVADAVVNDGTVPSYYQCYDSKSDSRDQLRIGFVTDAELGDEAFITYKRDDGSTDKVGFDVSKEFDTAVIDAKGNIRFNTSDASDISMVEPYDESTKTGCFVFMRHYKNAAFREIYLYRFEG